MSASTGWCPDRPTAHIPQRGLFGRNSASGPTASGGASIGRGPDGLNRGYPSAGSSLSPGTQSRACLESRRLRTSSPTSFGITEDQCWWGRDRISDIVYTIRWFYPCRRLIQSSHEPPCLERAWRNASRGRAFGSGFTSVPICSSRSWRKLRKLTGA